MNGLIQILILLTVQENRDAYIQFLESRLKNSDLFVKEAQDARQSLI